MQKMLLIAFFVASVVIAGCTEEPDAWKMFGSPVAKPKRVTFECNWLTGCKTVVK